MLSLSPSDNKINLRLTLQYLLSISNLDIKKYHKILYTSYTLIDKNKYLEETAKTKDYH